MHMSSTSSVWAACFFAALLLTTPASCGLGMSSVKTRGGGSTSVTSSESSSSSTFTSTSGSGQVFTGGEASTSTTGFGTTQVSSETIIRGTQDDTESGDPPHDKTPEATETTPEPAAATSAVPTAGDEPDVATEFGQDGAIVSKTVSEDGSQTTIASTDKEGDVAESISVSIAGPGEGPATATAISTTSDDGAASFAESSKEGSTQSDTVVTEKSDSSDAKAAASAEGNAPGKSEGKGQGKDKARRRAKREEDEEDELKDLIPHLPVCGGLAKFLCCDDKDFLAENGKTFCGCLGSDSSQGCNFFVEQRKNPLVVRDLRGLDAGRQCRCPTPDAIENECFGRTRVDCCEKVAPGAKKCKCIFEDLCVYEKVSNGVWKDTLFNTGNCVCPANRRK